MTSPQPTSAIDPAGTVPAGATLRLVETALDEEHDLQGHALALESHCLRRRAERYVEAIERGVAVGDEQIGSVLRAFRAYRPFLFDADRVENDAARRRLSRAVSVARAARSCHHVAPGTPDASVA